MFEHNNRQEQVDVQEPVSASFAAGKVWQRSELELLTEISSPIVIVWIKYPLGSSGEVEEYFQVVHQNAACLKRLGPFGSVESIRAAHQAMSAAERQKRLAWGRSVINKEYIRRTWLDIQFLKPFYTNWQGHNGLCTVITKPIRVELAPGQVEVCQMYELEAFPSIAAQRVTMMYHNNPVFMFLFDKSGKLLHANQRALDHYCGATDTYADGCARTITLESLFRRGVYEGGEAEMQRAYQEAVNAIFKHKAKSHHHLQAYVSRRTGKTKWGGLEMWPVHDRVTESEAMLVSIYNMTQRKALEDQLQAQRVTLQKQNKELEKLNEVIQKEKLHLEEEKNTLAQNLAAVVQKKLEPEPKFNLNTPIDETLSVLRSLIKGERPAVERLLDLHTMLTGCTTELRQPINLEQQLLQTSGSDTEVAASMVQLLQANAEVARRVPTATEGLDQHNRTVRRSSTHSVSRDHKEELCMTITPIVERMLQDAEKSWHFDIFGFAEATEGNTLAVMTFYFMKRAGAFSKFGMHEAKLCRYLLNLESGYNPLPYHNSIHVASVVQLTYMLMVHGGLMKAKVVDELTLLASLMAATVHDYGHGGVNNDFLNRTMHELSVTYHFTSPWENHHLAASLRLLLRPEHAYFAGLSKEQIEQWRCTITEEVLGTDMKKHFSILTTFLAATKCQLGSNNAEVQRAESVGAAWLDLKPENRIIACQMMLKCADIGHLAADSKTHKRWAYQLEEEFFQQGDKERALGMSISPLMDRNQRGGITRSQVGFFNIVGLPLFKAMADVFEDSVALYEGALANFRNWEAAGADDALSTTASA